MSRQAITQARLAAAVRSVAAARPTAAARFKDGATPANQISGLVVQLLASSLLFQENTAVTPVTADAQTVGWWRDLRTTTQRTWTQSTSTKRPLYKTGIANGHPSVRFDGVDDFLTASSVSELQINNDKTIVAVVNVGTLPSNTAPFLGNNAANWYVGVQNTARLITSYNNTANSQVIVTSASSTITTGVQLFVYRYTVSGSNVTVTLRRNGVQIGSTTNGSGYTASAVGTTWTVGSFSSTASFFNGDLLEIDVYNRSLLDAEVAGLESYLGTYYGLF